jgi:acyl-CoA synthetase (AMP-forming)/AMP-acid ligase II
MNKIVTDCIVDTRLDRGAMAIAEPLAGLIEAAPAGDARLWAQSLQDLVVAMLRDGRAGNIEDATGKRLRDEDVFAAQEQLRSLGVRPGEVVLVKANNDVAGAASVLGVWLHGCAICPVDPSAPRKVHELIELHSGAAARIDNQGKASLVAGRPPPKALTPGRATGVDLGLIIFTSGSSGTPKGVMLSNANVLAALRAISSYLEIVEQDKILSVPPMFLDYGLYQLLFSMFVGCRLLLAAGITNPLKILALIEGHRPSILPVVPALASNIARVLNTFNQTISSLRLISNTGGHLAPATIEAMARSFPEAAIYPMYGLTESKRALYLPPHLVPSKPGSVGGPMPGLDARVVVQDSEGQLVEAEPGQIGELYLRGASVMQRYHRADSSAGARLVPGRYRDDNWLATGDLFEMDGDGCMYFRGRSKSLIKQKGYCLYPRDIEAAAEALDGVASAVVVGRSEPDGDETAVLFVVTRNEACEAQRDAVRAQLRRNLHKSLYPGIIHFLREWPPSPVGKIDLNALKTLAMEL